MQCCRNQTTPFCPDCGADLEAKSLVGLKKHLEKRLQATMKRFDDWVASSADKVKADQGIARNTDTIVQLESWIAHLEKIIPHVPTS